MIVTTAQPQYDGVAGPYHVPDTASMHLYRIHGQVDQSKSKKSKTTFLSEIIDKAAKPGGSRPGPSDYRTEQALDYSKLHTTRRYQWDRMNKTTFVGDIQKRESNRKGPADYSDLRKKKVIGSYEQKSPKGQSMNLTLYMASESPGSGQYEAIAHDVTSSRSPRADLNRDKSPKKVALPT